MLQELRDTERVDDRVPKGIGARTDREASFASRATPTHRVSADVYG